MRYDISYYFYQDIFLLFVGSTIFTVNKYSDKYVNIIITQRLR